MDAPIYFLTTCTHLRKSILTSELVAQILVKEWRDARTRHGLVIGRYVIMPDHVHFFCAPEPEAKALSAFVGLMERMDEQNDQACARYDGARLAGGVFRSHSPLQTKAMRRSGITSARIRSAPVS